MLGFWLTNIGLLAIMVAAALPLFNVFRDGFGYVYAAGAAMLLAGRFLTLPSKDEALRVRRLGRMEVWTALVFAVGAVFIFLPQGAGNDWLAFTMAGGVLTIYTSIMIPRERKKAAEQKMGAKK
ncbi:MAG: hypothetical protein K2H88_00680 [Duncaniella sp.]|nr:hypothetical protein [Duncaniella sp.]MDE6358330.1 hypothetical protein [Duncaniella sp.]